MLSLDLELAFPSNRNWGRSSQISDRMLPENSGSLKLGKQKILSMRVIEVLGILVVREIWGQREFEPKILRK